MAVKGPSLSPGPLPSPAPLQQAALPSSARPQKARSACSRWEYSRENAAGWGRMMGEPQQVMLPSVRRAQFSPYPATTSAKLPAGGSSKYGARIPQHTMVQSGRSPHAPSWLSERVTNGSWGVSSTQPSPPQHTGVPSSRSKHVENGPANSLWPTAALQALGSVRAPCPAAAPPLAACDIPPLPAACDIPPLPGESAPVPPCSSPAAAFPPNPASAPDPPLPWPPPPSVVPPQASSKEAMRIGRPRRFMCVPPIKETSIFAQYGPRF